MQEIMEFIYWLVEVEELPIAKALRQILVDKQKQLHFQQVLLIIILCTIYYIVLLQNMYYNSVLYFTDEQ